MYLSLIQSLIAGRHPNLIREPTAPTDRVIKFIIYTQNHLAKVERSNTRTEYSTMMVGCGDVILCQ